MFSSYQGGPKITRFQRSSTAVNTSSHRGLLPGARRAPRYVVSKSADSSSPTVRGSVCSIRNAGSSPRARGGHRGPRCRCNSLRFIPAWAGLEQVCLWPRKSVSGLSPRRAGWRWTTWRHRTKSSVHPRACGVDLSRIPVSGSDAPRAHARGCYGEDSGWLVGLINPSCSSARADRRSWRFHGVLYRRVRFGSGLCSGGWVPVDGFGRCGGDGMVLSPPCRIAFRRGGRGFSSAGGSRLR